MKKLVLILLTVFSAGFARAQAEIDFPFQGGREVMADYFAKNIIVTDLIKQHAASGVVVMKFTSDQKGSIIKMVVYYADDASLTQPVIAALKGTDGKWIIPDKEKSYDFLIPFAININTPNSAAVKAMLKYLRSRSPITAADQIPLNTVTLLPTVQVGYDYGPAHK